MLAPLIAIVGCDGAGKSTLAADVVRALGAERRVGTSYLGLGSGEIGARIKRWPLIGAALERSLAAKAGKTRSVGERIPGLPTALVVYGFSLLRRRRFRRMLADRAAGVTVITDRYPQVEVPGFYDGPGLSAAHAGSAAVAWLAARERRMYEEMASHRPTLVIRLGVDAETAHARKPDHDIGLLRRKVAVTPALRFGGAPIVDLDSRAPYAQVRQRALASIRAAIADRVPARNYWIGMTVPDMAPLIAIVGSDGSGKSTVGEALLAWMNDQRPTELHHLGKQTGNIGRAIARWPLIGGGLDRTIVRQSGGAKHGGGPNAFTAAIIYAFSMRRVRRFRRMLAARRRGIAILADRFPQTAVPGPMDGLGLAKAAAGLPGVLARRERAHYDWMERHRPDLVIRLNVDLPTALARKPDHRPSSLAAKIADVPRLTFNGARIVDLDATQPLDGVIEQARTAIRQALGW